MGFPIVFLIVPVVGIILSIIVLLFCLFIILYYIHYRKSQRRSQEQRSSKHRNRDRRKGLQPEKSKEGKKYNFQNSTAIAEDAAAGTKRYELQLQSPNATDGDSPTRALSPKHNNYVTSTTPICSGGQSTIPNSARTASLPKNCRLSSDVVPSVETFQPSEPHRYRSSSLHYPSANRVDHGGQCNTTYDVPRKRPIYTSPAKEKYIEFYPRRPRSSSTGGVPQAHQLSSANEYYMPPNSFLAPEVFRDTCPQNGAGIGQVSVYDVPRNALIRNNNSTFHSGIGSKGCYDVPRSVMTGIGQQNAHPARKRNFSVPSCRDEIIEASMAVSHTDSGGAFDVYDYPTHFLEGHDPIPSPISNYDVPKSLLLTQRPEVAPYTKAWGLMYAKSIPSQGREGGVYAVPRSAPVVHSKGENIGPPTAKKPYRRGNMAQSRSFDLSPVVEATRKSGSSQRQYPDDVAYDVPPLDGDVVAERESSIAGALDRKIECSKFEQELQHVRLQKPHQQKSKTLPVKKKKVPPPTKRKPKKS